MMARDNVPALDLHDVSFVRDDRRILDHITWEVQSDERWLILGANGSGKTTLVRIASMYEHPSAGTGPRARRGTRSHRRACAAPPDRHHVGGARRSTPPGTDRP